MKFELRFKVRSSIFDAFKIIFFKQGRRKMKDGTQVDKRIIF